jgi:mono/diheme cytochrome c family protein
MFKPLGRLSSAFALPRSALATNDAPAEALVAAKGMLAPMIFLTCVLVAAPFAMAQSRGELLYTTHCISCHTTEMHWRDKRSASNWLTLQAQVRRWQDAASLAWGDSDILDVSRYLNETIYHFEQTAAPVSSSGRGIAEPVPALTRLALLRRP